MNWRSTRSVESGVNALSPPKCRTAQRLRRLAGAGAAGALIASLAGCMAGPDYAPPTDVAPVKFKENDRKSTAAGARERWKPISPLDIADRGDWWLVFQDEDLTKLVAQVEISNQTVAAAAAAYDQSRQLVREGQAGLFPTVTTGYTPSRSRSVSSGSAVYSSNVSVATNLDWEIDVWGRIRRTVEADAAAAQVSAADLANAKLSAQIQLAVAYFSLRTSDELLASIESTLVLFRRTRDILKNQYTIGTTSRADFVTADNQVLSTEATAINVGLQRAQYEHAIAVLIGRSPSELSIRKRRWSGKTPPAAPAGLPSELLERRPDIAAAERRLQQQNALIGVAIANFYPRVSLSPALDFAAAKPWPVTAAHEAWSLAGSATQTLFDGGLLDAQRKAAEASYRQAVATYRQTVLTAFQQVEDDLASIRALSAQVKRLDKAVAEAREAVDVYFNQYRVGTVAFTSVVTAQATLLSGIESALTARQNLFVATVNLIGALGGGWDASRLPAIDALSAIEPPLPVPASALPAAFETAQSAR
ncbi:transporter [Methylosinus sp. R-45379]|uniref:efflux transporter outer membrane subunit n=1 Tax=Methylosinus sp. R-45379 TaxID=980563 RepID=UPI0007D7C5DB|nr:efflux transporter outer membrane subunit [Methylosinus sp. R-45379]OAI23496.1 transporter [Methylosinus sp. R-45379]